MRCASLVRSTLLVVLAAPLSAGERLPAAGDELGALVGAHCVSCHGGARPKGRLDLADFDPAAAPPELLAELLDRVRSGEMPPAPEEGEESTSDFDPSTRTSFVEALGARLAALAPDPGRPTLRRLNRHEYANAVRALLDIELALQDELPEDASSEGFDNQGDVLFVTPRLVELYLDATEQAVGAFLDGGGPARLGLVGEADARPALSTFLERAFRRPPTEEELEARAALLAGEQGARALVASVLLSPHFLYRVEEDRDEELPWRIDPWELATRLSFFLWAAPPDAELREAAREGSLYDPAVLAAQVERLLDDPRSEALATRFAARWLGFADLQSQGVDVRRYRGTDDDLKRSMIEESTLFFDALVREDRRLLELVDSPSTFLDGTLARHYGIEGVEGGGMRRVELPDRRRGGVLTQASVLTLTSQPLRTSPVVRGAWILERLFGTPPQPPPPNAGSLPADDQLDDGLSLRQRLERHREDPSCASCHANIDPLGFVLENYDGVGRWRDEDHLGPIDARAVLPDGREIDGVIGLKDALLAEPEKVARGVAEALLVYALGRPLEPQDEAVVSELVAQLRGANWRARALIHGVVASYPFQYRRSVR